MKQSKLNTQKGVCFRCGAHGQTELHHLLHGTANRRLAEEDGLFVYLCPDCHNRPPYGAHFNRKTDRWLQRLGQAAYEQTKIEEGYTAEEAREMFMKRYGKNYL